MSELEEQECKIVNEFCHLLEKSKQLFNGLRYMINTTIKMRVKLNLQPLIAGTYLSMDISNGNLTLEGRLMYIPNCGGFNSSTGKELQSQ